ncbi:MAG TPA: M14 family zinc carboxypeptidase [Pyrinomonadaceae bacterium]|nr:M14 family zinc carboxypeptidase [Pyrinomonadaceae bacterium]
MRSTLLLSLLSLAFLMNTIAQTPSELVEIWERGHVTTILPSNVRHKDLQKYLDGLRKFGLKVDEVGRSYANREIYQVEFGKGPLKVFLWSQMHGDEPTATSALIDMFTVLQKNRHKDWVKRIESTMTIRAVPMLNPDGAELYQRRNLQGIDINRDAQNLQTPEANLLKKLRDEWTPGIGFNLHNQNSLTTAGRTNKQAAISFLVVYGDAAKTTNEGHERNRRLASAMVAAIQPYMPGHIGRYGDEWTPTAFGDNFSAWGTPVILIETGALHGKDEMFLVKMNFTAILTALKSVADGSEKNLSSANYDSLPENSSGSLFYFIFRNATVIDRSRPDQIIVGDIAINVERRRAEFVAPTYIRQIGNLSAYAGLTEFNAADFNVVPRNGNALRPGDFADLLFYKKSRQVDWKAPDLEKQFPPDAIFSLGKWLKGSL